MKNLLFVGFSFLLVFAVSSCDRTDLELEKSQRGDLLKPISISEARSYIDKFQSGFRMSSQSKIGYVWENAKESNLKNGKSIIIVPINYNSSSRVTRLNKEAISGNDKSHYLMSDKVIMYKDESGNRLVAMVKKV